LAERLYPLRSDALRKRESRRHPSLPEDKKEECSRRRSWQKSRGRDAADHCSVSEKRRYQDGKTGKKKKEKQKKTKFLPLSRLKARGGGTCPVVNKRKIRKYSQLNGERKRGGGAEKEFNPFYPRE